MQAIDTQLYVAPLADANPKNEAPLLKLAAFYYGTGRRPEMEASLARITSHPADFPMGRLTVGLFFARLRDFDRARKELEEGAKADAKSKATYQKAEAQLLAMQGKGADAATLEHPPCPDASPRRSKCRLQARPTARRLSS